MRGKSKGINKNIIFLSLIFIVLAVILIFILMQIRSDELTLKMERNEYVAVSINISDNGKFLFSELLIFNPETYKAAILNIPGNYGSVIESVSRMDRLDILYDYSKPEKMLKKIESITTIPVDFYINIDKENLVKVVDMLGGLELFIANPIETITDEEVILLPSGSTVLDGEKNLIFLLPENDNENDADLIGRWHKFVQAFIKKSAERSDYLQNKVVFDKYYTYFKTDLNKEAFASFLKTAKKFDAERMILQRILGDRKVIDNSVLLFPYYNGNLLRETVKQTLVSIKNEDILSDEEVNIKIEILNGTNIPGMAARTSHFFTNLGFDVVSTRNADKNDYDKTVVISRGANPSHAQKVASIIRCNNIESGLQAPLNIQESENSYINIHNSEVTIILGKDFDGRYCK